MLLRKPQSGQAAALSASPHTAQKLRSGRFADWHLGQFISGRLPRPKKLIPSSIRKRLERQNAGTLAARRNLTIHLHLTNFFRATPHNFRCLISQERGKEDSENLQRD